MHEFERQSVYNEPVKYSTHYESVVACIMRRHAIRTTHVYCMHYETDKSCILNDIHHVTYELDLAL